MRSVINAWRTGQASRFLWTLLRVAPACLAAACSGSATAPVAPVLKISSISPPMGSTTGGTVVTVVGAEFLGDTVLTVGGVAATSVVTQGTTTLTAVLGALPTAGARDVVVTSGGRSAVLVGGFTFFAPTGLNQPPVVTSIRSIGTRLSQPSGFADVGETVTLMASVADAETLASALAYEWSGAGTFVGSGATTTWQLPASLSPTPSPVTATLLVTETFAEGAVIHRHRTSASFVASVHDSQREVLDMGEDFLTRFSRSEVPTSEVLHNFSRTCDLGRGRADEEGDVDRNRDTYIHDFAAFRITRRAPFSINFRSACFVSDGRVQANTDACASFAVHWEVTTKSTGAREITNGVDYVSAVLENNQWKLCHSSFVGTVTYPSLGITRQVSW